MVRRIVTIGNFIISINLCKMEMSGGSDLILISMLYVEQFHSPKSAKWEDKRRCPTEGVWCCADWLQEGNHLTRLISTGISY